MTQRERVLAMLREKPCTYKDFLRNYISEYRTRINELKRAGYVITDERWENGNKWTLVEQKEMF